MSNHAVEEMLEDGLRHLCFAALICVLQHRAGRYFIFEHPDSAGSWNTRVLKSIEELPGVVRTKFDFCMLGMKGEDAEGVAPANKTTGILTNAQMIAEVLSQCRRDGKHRHVPLVNGRAMSCEVYPEEFCRKLCEAHLLQLDADAKSERLNKDVRSEAIAAVDVTDLMEPLVSTETKPEKKTESVARPEYCSWMAVPEDERTRLWCGNIGLSAAQLSAGKRV